MDVSFKSTGAAVFIVVQTLLTLREAGSSWQLAGVAFGIVAIQVVGGVLLVSCASRFLAVRHSLTLAVGLGTLLFAMLSVLLSPLFSLAGFIILCCILTYFLRNELLESVLSLVGSRSWSDLFIIGLAFSTIQFLFLSQFHWRFMIAGLVTLILTVFVKVTQTWSRGLSRLLVPTTFLIYVVIHVWLIATGRLFVVGQGDYLLSPDAAIQVSMAQGLATLGPFDSVLMAGVADKYHWLSWGWIGSVGMLSDGDYWATAEVVAPAVVAGLFSLSLLGLIQTRRIGSAIWVLGILCILVSDSALENVPTVDFGGSSGYFGLIWLMMIVPVAQICMDGLLISAQVWGAIGTVGSLLGKASYGFVFITTQAILVALVIARRKLEWKSCVASVIAPLAGLVTYLVFLRSSEKGGGGNIAINPKTEILGYRLIDQVDLLFRVIPLICLVTLAFIHGMRRTTPLFFGALVSFSSVFLLDIWGSGPMSLFWAGSLMVGLAVLTAEPEGLISRNAFLLIPMVALGSFAAMQIISWQWVGPLFYGPLITEALWLAFGALLVTGILFGLVWKPSENRLKQSVIGLLAVSVFFNSGTFMAQAFRNEIRPIADDRYGVEGRTPPTTTDHATLQNIIEVASFLMHNLEREEIYASNVSLQGPILAAFSGKQSFVESYQHSHSSPIEYARRLEIVEGFGSHPSQQLKNFLLCSDVRYFVVDLRRNSGVIPDERESLRNETLVVLDLGKQETAGCT